MGECMASSCHIAVAAPLTLPPSLLLIDDDPDLLDILVSILAHRLPYVAVETYLSAHLAASKLVDGHYDAVVTDLTMPELDGFAVLSQTKERRPCTSVLVITGHKDSHVAETAFHQGAFDFILKPFDAAQFIRSVDLAIKAHRLRHRIDQRREYIAHLREIMHRRCETPFSSADAAPELLRAMLEAPSDRVGAAIKHSESVVQRTERLLRRQQNQVQRDALHRLR